MSDSSAIKVHTAGSSYEKEKVKLYLNSSEYRMSLSGIPTELQYRFPPGIALGYDLYSQHVDQLEPYVDKIADKYGLAVAKAARNVATGVIVRAVRATNDVSNDEEFIEDISEIIDHLTTLLKAKLIAHASAVIKREHAELKSKTAQAIADLQQVLDKGESAIKSVPREEK